MPRKARIDAPGALHHIIVSPGEEWGRIGSYAFQGGLIDLGSPINGLLSKAFGKHKNKRAKLVAATGELTSQYHEGNYLLERNQKRLSRKAVIGFVAF